MEETHKEGEGNVSRLKLAPRPPEPEVQARQEVLDRLDGALQFAITQGATAVLIIMRDDSPKGWAQWDTATTDIEICDFIGRIEIAKAAMIRRYEISCADPPEPELPDAG